MDLDTCFNHAGLSLDMSWFISRWSSSASLLASLTVCQIKCHEFPPNDGFVYVQMFFGALFVCLFVFKKYIYNKNEWFVCIDMTAFMRNVLQ